MGDGPDYSRESMREVRREAKERQKAREQAEREARKAERRGAAASSGAHGPYPPDPVPWRGPTAAPPTERRRILPYLIAGTTLAMLIVGSVYTMAGGNVWGSFGSLAGGGEPASPPLYPTPTTTASTGAASPPPSRSPSSSDPFAGTGFAGWSVAAAGLVPPKAAAVKGYSAAQVADAYDKTKTLLHFANLDVRTLYGKDISQVTKRLDRASAKDLAARTAKPTEDDNPLYVITRFNPSAVKATSPVIKVNGSMRADRLRQNLRVTYDYAFVYALGSTTADWTSLISIRRRGEFLFRAATKTKVSAAWAGTGTYLDSGSMCGKPNASPEFMQVVFAEERPPDNGPDPTTSINPLQVTEPIPTWTDGGDHCYVDTSELGNG